MCSCFLQRKKSHLFIRIFVLSINLQILIVAKSWRCTTTTKTNKKKTKQNYVESRNISAFDNGKASRKLYELEFILNVCLWPWRLVYPQMEWRFGYVPLLGYGTKSGKEARYQVKYLDIYIYIYIGASVAWTMYRLLKLPFYENNRK